MRQCGADWNASAVRLRCRSDLRYLVWMWKLLVVPVCSKSWIAAAKTIARISNSLSQCCENTSTLLFDAQVATQLCFEWCLVCLLPSVPCATLGSEQSVWHQRHESGCGRGSCICCIHTPALRQTAPEPEPESKKNKENSKVNGNTCPESVNHTELMQNEKSLETVASLWYQFQGLQVLQNLSHSSSCPFKQSTQYLKVQCVYLLRFLYW